MDTKGTGRGEDAGGWGGRKGRQRARLFQETLLPSSGIRSTERICRGTVLMLLSTGWWLEQPRDANNVLRCCQAQGAYQTCQVRHKKQEESRRIARGLRAASAPTAPSPDDAVHEPAATPSWLASLRRYTADFHHKKPSVEHFPMPGWSWSRCSDPTGDGSFDQHSIRTQCSMYNNPRFPGEVESSERRAREVRKGSTPRHLL